MNKYQNIISDGKIPVSDVASIFGRAVNLLPLLVGIWGLYYVNTYWDSNSGENDVLFGNITTSFFILFGVYLLWVTKQRLKTTFYPDSRPIDSKLKIIEMQRAINHWQLKKTEKNYYMFYENNLLMPSYYITIVFDEKGFYLNCFPFLNWVLIFSSSQNH